MPHLVATILTLLVVPALYAIWRERQLRKQWAAAGHAAAAVENSVPVPAT